MKISVLMATYNGEKYIEEQLTSLYRQSRKIDEVIIVDDCSTDQTVSIVRSFIANNHLANCWKLHQNEENKGWKRNFIEGIDFVKCDLLFFCDQDDVWYQKKVEETEKVFLKDPTVNVVGSKEKMWNGKTPYIEEEISSTYQKLSLCDKDDNYLIKCNGCTMAIRYTYIQKILGYYFDGWPHDDFFWKISICDDSFARLNSPTILRRIHGDNASRKKRNLDSTLKSLKVSFIVTDRLLAYLKDNVTPDRIRYRKKILFIQHKQDGIIIRQKYLTTGKFQYIIQLLLKYADLYREKKNLLGDFALVHGFRK